MMQLYLVLVMTIIITLCLNRGGMISAAEFESDGEILELERSRRFVSRRGGPACALVANETIFVASARASKRSVLHLDGARKAFLLGESTLMVVSGVQTHGDALVDVSRRIMHNFFSLHQRTMPVDQLAEALGEIMHENTVKDDGMALAANLLLCGRDDDDRPAIFTVDCDGSFQSWKAVAIGKESAKVQSQLAKLMSCEDSIPRDVESFQEKVVRGILCPAAIDRHPSAPLDADVNPWDIEVFCSELVTEEKRKGIRTTSLKWTKKSF